MRGTEQISIRVDSTPNTSQIMLTSMLGLISALIVALIVNRINKKKNGKPK